MDRDFTGNTIQKNMSVMKKRYIIEYPLIDSHEGEYEFIEFMKDYKGKSGVVYFKLIDDPTVKIVTEDEYLRYIKEDC
jgi:hypothetical protein